MFKKTIIIVFVLVLTIIGAFAIPHIMDTENSKQKIIAYFHKTTGKELSILGEVKFTLLPTPKFIVKDSTLNNGESFTNPTFAVIPSMEIEVSPMSVISNDISIKNIHFTRPEINLERNKEGKGNWGLPILTSPQSQPDLQNNFTAKTNESESVIVSFSSGRLNIINDKEVSSYDNLDFTIKMINFNGPFDAKGNFSINNSFYTVLLQTGTFYENTETTIDLKINQKESETDITFKGQIGNIVDKLNINGSTVIDSKKIDGIYEFLTKKEVGNLPSAPFLLSFDINKNARLLNIDNAAYTYGDNRGSFTLKSDIENDIIKKLDAKVSLAHLNIDEFSQIFTDIPNLELMSIPQINIDFIADKIIYKGQSFANNIARISANNKKLDIQSFQTVIMDDTTVKGIASFDREKNNFITGNASIISSNFPDVFEWYYGKKITTNKEVFKNVKATTTISGTPENIIFNNMKVEVDKIAAQLNLKINTKDKIPTIHIGGKVNSINFDEYIKDILPPKEFSGKSDRVAYIINHMNLFPDVNKNLNLFFGYVNYKNIPYTNIKINMETKENTVKINEISGGIGSINSSLKGEIAGVNSNNPEFKNIHIKLDSTNPIYTKLNNVLSFLDLDSPLPIDEMKNLIIEANVNGSLLLPQIKSIVKNATLTLAFNGGLETEKNIISGNFDFRVNNFKKFLQDIGIKYQSSKPFGLSKITGKIKKEPNLFVIEDLDFSIGPETVSGEFSYNDKQSRPSIVAKLHTNHMTINDYFPESVLHLWTRGNAKIKPAWNKQPFDISLLKSNDIKIDLDFDSMVYENTSLQKGKLVFSAISDKVSLEIPNAIFFDGTFKFKSDMDLTISPYPMSLNGSIDNAKFSRPIFMATSFDIVEGTLSLNYDLKTNGNNVNDIIMGLKGNLNYKLEDGFVNGANLNKLTETVENAYFKKNPITEKEFSDIIDLYMNQGSTNVSNAVGSVIFNAGEIAISTQPFSVGGKGISKYDATVKLTNWDISSLWDVKIDNNEKLLFTITTEGALDTPRKKNSSEMAKQLIIQTIMKDKVEEELMAKNVSQKFSNLLKQLQLLMPQIRAAHQQTKELYDSTPELKVYYDEVLSLMKTISIEIKKIKQLYELKEKNEEDFKQADLALTNIESSYDKIKTEYLNAIRAKALASSMKLTTQIFSAEERAKEILKDYPEKSDVVNEIIEKADVARKALKLAEKITTLKDTDTLEKNLTELWDRVKYLIGFLNDTSPAKKVEEPTQPKKTMMTLDAF